MLRLLAERAKAGVEIRIFGKVGKGASGIEARKLADLRLHVRAIIRDGAAAFIGSQSLRKLELDGRREVGIIIRDARVVEEDAATCSRPTGRRRARRWRRPRSRRRGKRKTTRTRSEKATSGA